MMNLMNLQKHREAAVVTLCGNGKRKFTLGENVIRRLGYCELHGGYAREYAE
jgi:hypothetical protein